MVNKIKKNTYDFSRFLNTLGNTLSMMSCTRFLHCKFFSLILLVLIFGSWHRAMAAEIRGQVLDSGSDILLQGVRIAIQETDVVTYTERGGDFRLPNLPPGRYTLRVTYIGYPAHTETVVIENAESSIYTTVDFSSEAVLELEEFRVEGSLVGAAKALNIQRSAANVKNVVSSDAIGQFVDRNAAEALQRLPGISIQNSQGEGKFVIIRGADPAINQVAIDGVISATPEEDGRTTALNIISIDQLESIEVTKSWLPDMSANFIGGSINLITRSALDRGSRFMSAQFVYGSHNISEENSWRFNATYGDVLGKKKNIGIQFSFDQSEDNRGSDTVKTEGDGWFTQSTPDVRGTTPKGFQLEGLEFEDFIIKRERTGFSTKVEYEINDNHRFNFSFSLNQFDDDEILQATTENIDLDVSSYVGVTVFDLDVALAIGLDPNDPEVAERLSRRPEDRPIFFEEAVALGDLAFDPETKMYTLQSYLTGGEKKWNSTLTSDEIKTFQGGGEHRLFNIIDLDYKIYRSEANKDWTEQQLKLLSSRTTAVSGIMGSVPFLIDELEKFANPKSFLLNLNSGSIEDNKFTSFDERSGFEINLETKYQWLGLNWTTKVGGAGDFRNKKFERDFQVFSDVRTISGLNQLTLENEALNGGTLDNFMEDFGDFDFGPRFDTEKTRSFIADPQDIELVSTNDDITKNVTEAILKNFEATEDVTAFYFMQTLDWKGFKFISGVRYEKTDNTFTNNLIDPRSENLPTAIKFAQPGFWRFLINNDQFGIESFINEVTSERSYDHWLPAFHIIKNFSENTIVRASFTKTIARPKFTDLVPREIPETDGKAFDNEVELPNIGLKATVSTNFDLSFDHYFKTFGAFGINLFYKKLDGPIYEETRTFDAGHPIATELSEKFTSLRRDENEWKTTRKANAGKGEILGLEVSLARKFDFLPKPFNAMGLDFNATFVDSSVLLPLEERLDEEVPLFKQSDILANLSIYYEKKNILIRASMVWRGSYLDEVLDGQNEVDDLTDENKVGLPANSLDVYVADFFKLDIRAEYRFRNFLTIFFEGTNLTNEPLHKFYGNEIRLHTLQFTKPIFFVGIKLNR